MLDVFRCVFKYLDKHLALRVRAIGSAVHRHGLPVSGKLQCEFFLHQLFDNLREISKKREIERERMWDVRSNKGETLLSLCVCVCVCWERCNFQLFSRVAFRQHCLYSAIKPRWLKRSSHTGSM